MENDLEWRYEDLRNDLVELQRVTNIEAAQLRQENADLRRQLAECQGEAANLRRERSELLAELDGMSAELAARR